MDENRGLTRNKASAVCFARRKRSSAEPQSEPSRIVRCEGEAGLLPVLVRPVQGMEAAAFSAVRAELVSLYRGS